MKSIIAPDCEKKILRKEKINPQVIELDVIALSYVLI